MTAVYLTLDDEHLAMLDAICVQTCRHRSEIVRELLFAVLEDDAAEHGAYLTKDGKVILRYTEAD